MAGQNKINFEVGFQINSNNLRDLQKQLTQITTTMNNAKAGGKLTKELEEAGTMARQLSSILESSFNKDLGTLNITKFNEGLKQAGITSEQVRASLIGQGNAGVAAYSKLATSILNTNVQLKEQNKLLNDMATTMTNTVKWGVASSVLNTMTGAIRDAYNYAKQLDTSLTDIRIVTGDSADQMSRFAEQANAAAKNMGANTLDYTKAALAYYQQGLGDEAVANRTEATIKAANVTGARASEVAENLTAVWNGFQAQIGTETDYVDKLAAVADSSASNLAELATAMSKVASIANNMGVDMDQLTAQISTIVATTRQAPETVGNALKTIYARINDIKTGSDEAEISLGNYTGKMASLGINVLDATGHLRDTGEVMEEIGEKWGTMGREQQIYLAQTMAGQRQMNNLVALFDNWTQYSDMLNVSLNAQGALDEKNNRYLESTQAHLNELKSTYQDLYATLINSSEINAGIDTIRNLVQVLDNFLEGFGGGIKSVTAFGSVVAFVFRDQIGQAIGQFQVNSQIAQQNLDNWAAKVNQIKADLGSLNMATATPQQQGDFAEASINQQNAEKLLEVRRGLTAEQQKQLIEEQAYIGALEKEAAIAEATLQNKIKEGQLDQLQRQSGQGYTDALEEELELKRQEAIASDNVIAAEQKLINEAQTRIALLKDQPGAIEAVRNAEEQIENSQREIKELEEQITAEIYEQAQARREAAVAADQLEQESEAKRGEQSQRQDSFDRQIDYAATIAQAKARTDAWTSSIGMLTTAWGAFSSLFRTLSDENASAMDKFTQILMTAGFAAPMLVKQFQTFAGAINTLSKGLPVYQALNAAIDSNIARNEILSIAVKKGVISQELSNKVKKEGIGVLSAHQAAEVADAAGVTIDTTATTANTGGFVANTTALVSNTIELIKNTAARIANAAAAHPMIAAAVAIGAAVVAAGYAMVKAYDAQKNRAKEAAQAAHDAQEQATEARNAYDELKTSLDNLKGARSTLNGLKEGTEEWKEAVLELNEQVLALLDKYPELSKYITNENGVLGISQEGIDKVLDDQLAKAQAAQEAAITASANSAKQAALADAQQVGRDAGTVFASPEKILEAAQIYAEHAGEIVEAGDQGAKVFQNLAGLTERDAEALLKNTGALLDLNTTAKNLKIYDGRHAENALGENQRYASSEYKDEINEVYNERYNAAKTQIKSGLTQSVKDGGYTQAELADMYAEITGATTEEQLEEIQKLSKSELAERIAGYQATQQLAKEENDIIEEGIKRGQEHYNSLTETEKAAQDLISKFGEVEQVANEKAYSDQQAAIGKISETGSLSADDSTPIEGLLTANGESMDQYFTKMADGTYQLIGDVDEFKKHVDSLTLEPFKEQIRSTQEQIDAFNTISTMGKSGITSRQFNNPEGQQAQLDYLAAAGYEDTKFLGELQNTLNTEGKLSNEQVKELADACRELSNEYDNVIAKGKELGDAQEQTQQQLANGAKSIEELNNQLTEGLITQDQYNEALLAHGANQDVDAERVREYTDLLSEEADTLDWVDDSLEDNEEAATGVAAAYEDAIEGVEAIQDAWDDWNDAGLETPEVIEEITDVLEDMFNTDIPDGFVTDHLDEIQRLAEGDMTALDDLRVSLASLTTEDIEINPDVNLSTDQFEIQKQNFLNEIANTDWGTITVGSDIDDAPFYNALNSMIQNSNMSRDQINSLLSQIGYVPNVKYITIPANHQVASQNGNTYTYEVEGLDGEVQTVTLTENLANQVASGQSVTIPVITGSKFAGGGVNTGNIGGNRTAPKSTGGGGGKGGKGKKGGGKGKKVQPAKKKEIKKDPYHDVNRQLGIVEDNLKKLQKEEKKLTGKQYLDNLVKQNQQLEKQRKLIKQKADIATAEVKRQQQELSRNYGFGFNSDGDISNYFNVLAKYQKQVEDLYNKAQKSPSETNNAKYQKATEDYDAMMKAIDAYEKDLDIYNKQLQDDQDALNDMIENNIKRFNYTIDLHLDTADFEKDLKEFRRDVLDQIKEDDYINLSSYGLSIGQDALEDTKELAQHVKDIQNAIAEMNRGNYNASPYHDDMKSAMEDLQKYTEELMKRGEDIADIQEDIHDNWMDAIDDAQNAFDEQRDEYEQINDLIEHNLDMLEMLHGDEAYSQMANLYQQQADNSMKNIQLLAKERDFWFQQMNSVAEGSDAWKEYRKNWEDAVKDLNSGIKDTADYFYNRYEAIFNQLAKQLKDTFAGGDWNKRQTLWEDFLDDDDRYLDSLSRANGTYNLIQKTQEAISNANLKHQKELNKWLDATTKNLENQTELRQIDLDIAEKELDIILKRQALEDAQNNKTKMRLRRDSQGNYRYQYIADTNDVAQKQQELRDAIEDLRLLVKEDFKDTVDRMYDQMDSFAEEAADISEKYGFNTEEWNDQMALLQERYIKKTTKTANDYAEMMRKLSQATGVEATELFGQMGDEFMAALGMDSDTYKVFEQMFKPGGEYVDLIDGFITEIYTSSFDGVAEDVKDTFNDVTNLLPAAVADLGNNLGERIRDMLAQFMSDASDNQQEYVKNLEDVQNETGQHFDDLTTNMEGTIKATEDLLLDNDKLITSYGDVINKVQEFADAIAKVVEQYKALSEAQINSTANTLLGNEYYQNGTTGVARYGVGGEDIRSIDENVDSISQVLRQLSSYDEGGWTGGGAELAVVHPNEYVLTSTDAPNMLAAAQIASQVMDRVADFKAAAMSQVGGAIGGLFNSVANADNSTTNEQQIIINADFPAVESAREIKQAFNELVNLASQRASGNRRTY